MLKKIVTKTGRKAQVSGQYGSKGTKSEITLSKGDRVPPYQGKARNFYLKDKTVHKDKK